MKKLAAVLLIAALFIPTGVFAQEVKPSDVIGGDTQIAVIEGFVPKETGEAVKSKQLAQEGSATDYKGVTQTQSLVEALMLLNSGRVDALCTLYPTAQYIASGNKDLMAFSAMYSLALCMLAGTESQEIVDELNKGIEAMLADGSMDELWASHVDAVLKGTEPEAVQMPVIEGGRKIRVGVSGDIPPMDYVAADGTAAGFNTAMLAHLAEIANLDIELVSMDSGARFAALASGRIDVFFWQTKISYALNRNNFAGNIAEFGQLEDEGIQSLSTEPYAIVPGGWLVRK